MKRRVSLLLALCLLFASCGEKREIAAELPQEQTAGTGTVPEAEPEQPAGAAPETEKAAEEPDREEKTAAGEEAITVEVRDWREKYEAEEAKLTGNSILTSGANGTSGKGYVGKFESSSSAAEFTVTVPEDGMYELFIAVMGIWGRRSRSSP